MDNNRPEDLFAKIMASYAKSEGPGSSNDYKAKEAAEFFYNFMSSFVNAGFTREEAFGLVNTMIQSIFSNLLRLN